MAPLKTEPNIANSDDFYAALLHAHEGLTEEETHRLNARLVLILANHIGDSDTLNEALAIARGTGQSPGDDPTKA